MTKHYETVFIMTPVLSAEQAKETVAKFKKELKSGGAKIVHEEDWGLRKLAYPIQKKTTGFYHLIEFAAEDGQLIPKLETSFRRDERILRFLTMKMDKHAVAYAETRRKSGKNSKKKEETEKVES